MGIIGGCPAHPTPQGPRFFRFHIQNFRNVTASGVYTPLRGPAPPTGNPGSATGNDDNNSWGRCNTFLTFQYWLHSYIGCIHAPCTDSNTLLTIKSRRSTKCHINTFGYLQETYVIYPSFLGESKFAQVWHFLQIPTKSLWQVPWWFHKVTRCSAMDLFWFCWVFFRFCNGLMRFCEVLGWFCKVLWASAMVLCWFHKVFEVLRLFHTGFSFWGSMMVSWGIVRFCNGSMRFL